MNYQKTKNRLDYLSNEFSESNMNSKEIISPTLRSEINKKYKEKQDTFDIDRVLNLTKPYVQKMVKEEVYQICNSFQLVELCYNCKIEVIISVIILYVWKRRNSHLKEEQTVLWRKYRLTWRKYGLIVGRLLEKTRENGKL